MNKDSYIEKAAVHNAEYRERNRAVVAAFLEASKCNDCGVGRDRSELIAHSGGEPGEGIPVWAAVNTARSVAVVLRALAQSIIVCPKCLHLRTAARNAWVNMDHEQRDLVTLSRTERP